MSRKGLTGVKQEKFVIIVQRLGMDIKPNRGWLKCSPKGAGIKRSVGIPTTKSVTRIELIGFTHELAVAHPKPPAKTVEQMIDFAQDEKLILQNFYLVCKHLCAAHGVKAEGEQAQAPAEPEVEIEVEQEGSEAAEG